MLKLKKVIEGFDEGARLDWIHPCHGCFPDFAGIYLDEESGSTFEVLVWEDGEQWVSAVVSTDDYHNGYPRSYRWFKEGNGTIFCRPNKGEAYDVDLPPGDKTKHIALSSVHVHMMTEPNKK